MTAPAPGASPGVAAAWRGPARVGRLVLAAPSPVPLRDGAALAAAALVLYAALRQRALHGLDVPDFINWLQGGQWQHHLHYLFMPLVAALHRVLAAFGATPHETLLVASHAGSAAGVFAFHRAAAALGVTRRDAALIAALVATTPGNVFFATVAEIHGVFLAFAGAACWSWARWSTRPSAGTALLLGASTAVAAAVHATGHLLVALLAALTLGLRGRVTRRESGSAVVALGAHALLTVALDAALRRADVGLGQQGIVGFLRQSLAQLPLEVRVLRDALVGEWLVPFLPLSLVPLAALAARSVRRLAGWVVAALAVYLAMTAVLLFGVLVERGAYLLPLAWPAAVLAVALLPRPAAAVLGLAGCGLAIAAVVDHDRPHDDPALVAAVAAIAEREPVAVVVADAAEYEPLLRDMPSVPTCPLFWFGQAAARGYEAFCAEFDAAVSLEAAQGRRVLLSARARAVLEAFPDPTAQRFCREHLPERYTLAEVRQGGFTAFRLDRR